MAFFALLWKARTIEKYRLDYEKEKINSIVMGNTQMEQTLSQRWRHYRYDTQKRISRTFKKWYPEGSGVANFFLYLTTDQTFPNFLLKSLMGFVGGIVLTYLCFMFFVFQLSISLIHATIMSSIIGVLLTLGLAFSYRIRCLVFLLIPQFFSRVGRYTLTCYALVLILTGPATNTLKNSEVLSESMACAQEQIKSNVHRLNDLMKKPYNSMKDSIKQMTERLQVVAKQVKLMIIRLNRLVMSLVGVIKSSFSWLQSISKDCRAKLGAPYNRCRSLLQKGIADCKQALKPEVAMICNIAYITEAACATVKPFKTLCYVTDFMDEAILASIRKKLRDFTAQIRALFQVKIHIHHSYSFSNITRAASQGAAGIVTEIRNRADPLLTWLSWSSCVTSLFLLLIIFRAKNYQHMYETRSHFDNRYVTKEFQELDLKRQRQGRGTVLPLNRRERAKYITTTSFRLVASEKVYLTRSAVFMAVTTFKLLIHMVADYSLFWVLVTIRYHGKYQTNLIPGVPETGAYVTGDGFVARMFTSIVDTLNLPLSMPAPSLIPCLPDPYPPDFKRYSQIGVLIFLLWFFALFEPYGLRLRHLIMGQYRPERAKTRAAWLYNHILRSRAGFMKFARKKLHREYKYTTESSSTFSSWLADHVPFQWLKYLLGIGPKEPHCLLCGTTSSANDRDSQLTRCKTPRCPGIYCTQCYSDIGQLCTICMSPDDYGDQSDVSLEKGSSDDSDDESPDCGTSNTNANIRMSESQPGNRSRSKNTWKFFSRTQRTETQDIIPLRQHNGGEDKEMNTNKELVTKRHGRRRKKENKEIVMKNV
ncbi:DC-STAMP domain-containing protein 2-like [Anticarsia gemmatalis]|uniref:DC-STAMP domain-containing protein 2-like n=1 Tax=Anticarsia gemmatalis TaxID=129554 RepID=UPI003F76FE1D